MPTIRAVDYFCIVSILQSDYIGRIEPYNMIIPQISHLSIFVNASRIIVTGS